MPKKIFCEKCGKQIDKNHLYIPGSKGKWRNKKLCRECFENVLNEHWNGNGEVKGKKK